MRKRRIIDWDLVDSCATRGVITVRELEELGVPRQTISRRLQAGGPWTRLLPGVALLATGPPTVDQRIEAALRYAGHAATVTGLAAAAKHGLRRSPQVESVHVLVPSDRRRRAQAEFVQVERTQRLPEPVHVHTTPIAPLPAPCSTAHDGSPNWTESAHCLPNPYNAD
ncbi:type IV toxin-antitoxin system AbiEi family antitoxin domain-containing protein [Allosaccharopolyspora coralli]|uniref:type IV toxin-antitoxin system AbiEi family antitoxin domain-containing protein n=1 Tax=Allosaccharopolyspora coralli TaxID=2665642 RepID=UPI001E50395F|nr:type IV toxin-antitoxin system AbiEi family antitoxin domain-containing protein [Allosaccharopolyspora coralli]